MVRFIAYDVPPHPNCSITSVEVHLTSAHTLFTSRDWGFVPTFESHCCKRNADSAVVVHVDGVLYSTTRDRCTVTIDFIPSQQDPLRRGTYSAWKQDDRGRWFTSKGVYGSPFTDIIRQLTETPCGGTGPPAAPPRPPAGAQQVA